MQVYKAWSASFGVCEGAPEVVVAPVVVTVRRPALHTPKPPPPRPAHAPCPLPPRQHAAPPEVIPAGPEATAHWLRRAVTVAIVGRELGSEAMGALLAARLDLPHAAALACLRDNGQLGAAIGAALRAGGLQARPEVPIERSVRSALRRYALRDLLPLPMR